MQRHREAIRLRQVIDAFFAEIDILPWTPSTADCYARLRAEMDRSGKSPAPLDMLIAAHALEAGATLVTNDGAFRFVPGLTIEDWRDG